MNKIYIRIIAAFISSMIVLTLSGCNVGKSAEAEEKNSFKDIDYSNMTLSDIADLIYENIEIDDITAENVKTVDDETVINEQYYMDLDIISDYEVRDTEGKFGVADVALFKIADDRYEDAMSSLELRKDDRISEFSNYDVLDSYTIAQEAEIYQSGDLVIMLMLDRESRETAMEIIEAYIESME